MMENSVHQRLWEIDLLRGLALVLMVVYHFLYDLNHFFGFNIAYNQGLFFLVGKAAAVLFIFVAGISAPFSTNNMNRGLKLIAWGYVIFFVTNLAVPGSNIVFGILQFLGVCILLSPVLKKFSPYPLAVAGMTIIMAGEMAAQISVTHNWLVPLGFWGSSFSSADYFPLLPWSGVFLLGMSVQKLVYRQKRSLLSRVNLLAKPLVAVGKRTLVIYLVHQPVILTTLYLIFNPRGLLDMLGNSLGFWIMFIHYCR